MLKAYHIPLNLKRSYLIIEHVRPFGKSHLSHLSKRERKWHVEAQYHMQDFTKSEAVQKHLQNRVDVFRKLQPAVKLSSLAKKEGS